MKKMILALTLLALAVGFSIAQDKGGNFFTPAIRNEYVGLVKANRGEAAVRAWASKHKLEIVSLKGYDIMVIPGQGIQSPTTAEAAGSCDATKCPTAKGGYAVANTAGQGVGWRGITCTATSCYWTKDALGRWNRICGDWKCKDDGSVIMFPTY
jgi:hypothetical protein